MTRRTALSTHELPESFPQRVLDTYNETLVKQDEPNGRTSYAFSGDITGEVDQ